MKQLIKNSNNEDLCIEIFAPNATITQTKLAIICHGITGYKEQDVIIKTAETLQDVGYTVITFDCRNSRGESYNNGHCGTTTSMFEDLSTVIDWAKTQTFYTPTFLLVGHSLGGSVVLRYTQKYPQLVNRLILISTIFDGHELYNNTAKFSPEFMRQLQNGGIIRSRNNVDCFLDETYIKDLQQYDFYKNIQNYTMPTLVITGDKDTASLPENNRRFYEALKCRKELHIFANCSHIYDTKQNQLDLSNKIENFLTS